MLIKNIHGFTMLRPASHAQRTNGLVRSIRNGNLVDQHWAQKDIDTHTNAVFTHFDCKASNVINMPLGFMLYHAISQHKTYILEQNDNHQYFGKIFWRGRTTTHDIRPKIIKYFISQKSHQVDIKPWNIDQSKYVIYGQSHLPPPPKTEYDNYFNGLKNSDFFLVMRGDKPWTKSFMDCLRAGAIPICIDTFYPDMGWHNINIKPEDLFLHFNTDKYSVEEIYHQCLEVLQDKERIMYMKNNVNHFYKKYILTDKNINNNGYGWSDFIDAKMLEIKRNDYKMFNNQFISPIVNEVKGF